MSARYKGASFAGRFAGLATACAGAGVAAAAKVAFLGKVGVGAAAGTETTMIGDPADFAEVEFPVGVPVPTTAIGANMTLPADEANNKPRDIADP